MQLTANIFLGDYEPDFDAQVHLAKCYEALGQRCPTSAILELLDVPDQEAVLGDQPAGRSNTLASQANFLAATVGPHLPAADHAEVQVSALTSAQNGLTAGTVVLVRRTAAVTEQYAFPFLQVDLRAGRYAVAGLDALPKPPSPGGAGRTPRVMPMMTPREAGKDSLSFLLAVAPFLPPPYGAAATGALTVLNMLVDATAPKPPNPYAELKADLESFLRLQDLKDKAVDPLNTVDKMVSDSIGDLSSGPGSDTPIQDLDDMPAELITLWSYIDGPIIEYTKNGPTPCAFDGEGWTTTLAAATSLWGSLGSLDETECTDVLALFLRAVTLQVMLAKLSIQARALACNLHQKDNNATAFAAQTKVWCGQVGQIADSLGVDKQTGQADSKWMVAWDEWTDDLITEGKAQSGWVPRIRAWYAGMRKNRVSTRYISDLYRVDLPLPGLPTRPDANYGAVLIKVGTWTWTDSHDTTSTDYTGHNPDHGEYNNRTYDTKGEGCLPDDVQHKDLAEAARNKYMKQVQANLDVAFADTFATVAAWGTLISEFYEILPPGKPAGIRTVSAPSSGAPADTTGTWKKGTILRYSVSAVNEDHGPGPASKPSPEYKVGDLRGAVLGGLPNPQGADSLWLYRQARTSEQHWASAEDAMIVGIITADPATKAMPLTYTDTSD